MNRPLNDREYWSLVRHNQEIASRCRELEATLENIRGEIIPSYMKLLENAESRAAEAQKERDLAKEQRDLVMQENLDLLAEVMELRKFKEVHTYE